MEEQARKLDAMLFQYEFTNGDQEDVIKALQTYQNQDGGFGNGLEPDIQLPKSSVIATTVALQYADFLDLDPQHSIIEGAIQFLVDNFREEGTFWPSVPLEVMDYPHAPWWNVSSIAAPDLSTWSNPNAEIAGYLNRYSDFVEPELLDTVNDQVKLYLDKVNTFSGNFWYDFLCWKRALPHLPKEIQKMAFIMLDGVFSDVNVLSQDSLSHLQASWLVTEPSSYLNQKFPDRIHELLLESISKIGDDGAWHPQWSWGDESEIWKRVEVEWSGKITNETISTLKYFDLIEL